MASRSDKLLTSPAPSTLVDVIYSLERLLPCSLGNCIYGYHVYRSGG